MQEKHLETLEFPKILNQLARHTSFSAAEELAFTLRPSTDPETIDLSQRETTEACRLLDSQGQISMGGIHDLRPLVNSARKGVILPPEELLDVRDTLSRGRSLRRTLGRLEREFPILAGIAQHIEECAHVVAEIRRCVNDRAEIVDDASPSLARIRQELSIAHRRLMDRLRRIVSSPEYAVYLQEPIVTQRHGRYVVPLKADFKGRIPGLIHDESNSGATVFIEPLATVELNNAVRELQLEEQREVNRILGELSTLVADEGDFIIRTVEVLARLDFAFAKAHYSAEVRGVQPRLVDWVENKPYPNQPAGEGSRTPLTHPGSTIRLKRARHPLLRADEVVPIDVYLSPEDGFSVIVITGPNTGGKTVSLKTVGLLTCMAQAGLHIPADEGSLLTPFDGVFADIGDEQSIEQSLSTFSSHMVNLKGILKEAGPRSLVLLDELGAGTDPIEGSALARAILSFLLRRGVTTLATTHYSDLKVYAHVTPGVINASVEFDLETLSPTYELSIGLPGRSNAFAIASRLSLPPAIIAEAQALLPQQTLEAEGLLADLKEAQRQSTSDLAVARDLREKLERQTEELRQRLLAIEQERQEVLETARQEAEEELQAIRREVTQARNSLRLISTQAGALNEVAQTVNRLDSRLSRLEPKPLAPQLPPEEIGVGDVVWVPNLKSKGEVVSISEQGIEVQVGQFRVQADRHKLRRISQGPEKPSTAEPHAVRVTTHRPVNPSLELDMRGWRVEEGLTLLERYLDDAYLSGLPWARIIHGRGTGALRRAVRELLVMHPLVNSFRSGEMEEGGDGVTVVEFAKR